MSTGEKSTEGNPIIEEPEDENEEVDEVEHEDDGEEEEKEGDEEEEDEEDDDQNFIIFENRATLLAKANKTSDWSPVALGTLVIYYDSNIFGAKIILKADETNKIVSNTIISMNTQMQVKIH